MIFKKPLNHNDQKRTKEEKKKYYLKASLPVEDQKRMSELSPTPAFVLKNVQNPFNCVQLYSICAKPI